ncbi:helix-turn-helix domain-containing protein [Nocardia cyriacigeorgica]|uniref:Helix-turn-helix domain-containing protein n=1 Tax=Nocardia cyriacigeorgica TaxID=135487 RepID=A0A6P1D8S2_9NOCA|nr:helix-turn-helix transcriptional regulator [Nocardia cyriacigeorgica]NEW46039.1 helix-turn-helix domain-containing protein [Nocardia cyriacigeorgica]NEW53232.1 helix-turn-helix domain-containing protein [Nocardia cyriacigeorgica]NEW57795.1 helix-turn-helix domain-containing protein [Nocardia cyriacigeorgica]
MTNSVHEQREALGKRLREMRKDAGLTARRLAALAGWHESKVSKVETGDRSPTEADLRTYCAHTGNDHQLADLIASLRNIESAYQEWRKVVGLGTKRRQHALVKLTEDAQIIRIYNPYFIPGFLQTAEYAAAVLHNAVSFYQTPNDVEAGVAKRMERQQLMYRGTRRFHFLIGEQTLYTTVGNDDVMVGQLDRLLAVAGLPRVTLGILPNTAGIPFAPTNFSMFDQRVVFVEAVTAELTITQPREIALYGRAFDVLAGQSVTGERARELIRKALDTRRG